MVKRQDKQMHMANCEYFVTINSNMNWTENNLCLPWILMRGGAIVHFVTGQLFWVWIIFMLFMNSCENVVDSSLVFTNEQENDLQNICSKNSAYFQRNKKI